MRSFTASRTFVRAMVSSLAAAVLIALLIMPAATAALPHSEQILRIVNMGRPADGLALVESRLTFPPGSAWETDPDAGPLSLAVEEGRIGVALTDGLARIERQLNPLEGGLFERLQPGRMTYLWPGDKLIVIRGVQLRVVNDEDAAAALGVSRFVHERAAVLTVVRADMARDQPL